MTQDLSPQLRALIARLLRHPGHSAAVDEYLQEVWLRVFEQRERIPDAETDEEARVSLRRWLCVVARNRAINLLKQEQSQDGGNGQSKARPIDPVAGSPSPSAQVAWHSLYERIWAELDKSEQKVVDLYLDSLTYAEIGEQVGLKPEGVRSKMQKIREQVRRLLARWGSR